MANNKKDQWIEGTVRIDEINIGDQFINWGSKQLSTVTGKTSNSVEMYNRANWKSRTDGKVNGDGEAEEAGRLKGISSKNWYAMDQFNRTFVKVDDLVEYKLQKLLEWSTKRLESNRFAALYSKFEYYL